MSKVTDERVQLVEKILPKEYKYHFEKVRITGKRKCIHMVNEHDKTDNKHLKKDGLPSLTGKIKEPGKQNHCESFIKFTLLSECGVKCSSEKRCKDHNLKDFTLEIHLLYHHNHPVQCDDHQRFRKVDQSVKDMMKQLLDEDMTPSCVYRELMETLDKDDPLADCSKMPDYRQVFNYYQEI